MEGNLGNNFSKVVDFIVVLLFGNCWGRFVIRAFFFSCNILDFIYIDWYWKILLEYWIYFLVLNIVG